MHEQTFNADAAAGVPLQVRDPGGRRRCVLLQGIAEMVRCVVCLRTGEWTPRLKDAEEMDVVEQQLAEQQLRRRGRASAR